MHVCLLKLAFVLALPLTPPCCAGGPPHAPPAAAAGEVRLKGELRYYRHIDPVTGQGAVSLHAGGKEVPLDFRQFKKDILLPAGPYEVKGHWSKEQRLVVIEAHPIRSTL